MYLKQYPVQYEIAGFAGMFTRPDSGASPISYPAPTRSALKAIFESVVFSKKAYFQPRKVEICKPIIYHKYTTNYRGPLRKPGTPNFQLFATVLSDVCYKVYGDVLSYTSPRHLDNPQHQLQEVFTRRLAKGEFYTTPALGWKEFVPYYFGPLRDETVADTSIYLEIPSMLDGMYDRATYGSVSPQYLKQLEIVAGVLVYDQ